MKCFTAYRFIGVVALLGVVLAAILPVSAAPDRAGRVSIALQFEWVRAGRVGIVRATGDDLADVHAVFQGRIFYFYPEDSGYTGLISVDMASDAGTEIMQVWVNYGDGTAERIDQDIEINHGEFGSIKVSLPVSMQGLLVAEVEEAEMARLFNIMDRFTPKRYWAEGGFVPPSGAPEIGDFGTWRLYNDTYWRRHTGIDQQMAVGTPIPAVASGRVMLSETLSIRGGYVLIDHGWGIYSGYAHLSQRLVVPGQWVHQGDVIGLSGLNGRSTGAHLHWEMVVGGVWVHPNDFMLLGLGAPQK